ncbi:MAG TPA: RNA 2',3'-cyclic phosphodiesterase [Gammaproteobacteria bacterium]
MTSENATGDTDDKKRETVKKPSQRLFFALWPDEQTREAIDRFTRTAVEECGGTAIAPENFHMTLRFVGNADAGAMSRMRKAAERVRTEPLRFKLDQLGFWAEPAVFWLGCRKAPDPLLRLVVNLNTEMGSEGFLVETRPFKPHVTLARNAHHAPQTELRQPVEWSSDKFVLVGSRTDEQGATYTVLEEWPLAKQR